MDRNEELSRHLVMLLKVFKNRPYHLAKYLIDNSALNNDFTSKLLSSDKLKKISDEESENKSLVPVYFVNISQMDKFYDSFIDDVKKISTDKNKDEVVKEINKKLDDLIKSEKFEEAARVRDYMIRNGIKRINF